MLSVIYIIYRIRLAIINSFRHKISLPEHRDICLRHPVTTGWRHFDCVLMQIIYLEEMRRIHDVVSMTSYWSIVNINKNYMRLIRRERKFVYIVMSRNLYKRSVRVLRYTRYLVDNRKLGRPPNPNLNLTTIPVW